MLELLGSGYVIDHCISAFRQNQENKAFRVYVTDSLRAISQNTAMVSEQKYWMEKRWIDLINPVSQEPEEVEDPRSCEEIAADIWRRIRGEK